MILLQLKEIHHKLSKGVIPHSVALKDYFEIRNKKPWQHKEWHRHRARLKNIGCLYCKSSKNLVLQHKNQPLKYDLIKDRARNLICTKYLETHNIDIKELAFKSAVFAFYNNEDEQPQERLACPVCKSVNVRQNKKDKTWHCQYKHHPWPRQISEPIYVDYYPKAKTCDAELAEQRRISSLRYKIENEMRWAIIEEHYPVYQDLILLMQIKQTIKYWQFDVITLCKKHAFLEDMTDWTHKGQKFKRELAQ